MAESRRMSKSELFTHFAERFGIRRAEAGEFFDELQQLTEQELCGAESSCFRGSRSWWCSSVSVAWAGTRRPGRGSSSRPSRWSRRASGSSSRTWWKRSAVTPHAFITKWRASALKERSGSQAHFNDLCRLLGELTPDEADPSGETYCFEKGVRKDTGGAGWADVWKRHHFAWEYKGKRANLDAAFDQLRQYSLALENPPLLIVSDMVRFRIRTNWTNSVSRTYEFELDDLADASTRDRLKWAFSDPDRLRPGETRQSLIERVAASFASVAQALRERGHDPQAVAHFVNRLVFCMFADDVGLLRTTCSRGCCAMRGLLRSGSPNWPATCSR